MAPQDEVIKENLGCDGSCDIDSADLPSYEELLTNYMMAWPHFV